MVVRCEGCGLCRTDPRPTPSALKDFYPNNYVPFAPRTGQQNAILRLKEPLKRAARRLHLLNTRRIPSLPPGKLLEIGCGPGFFLREMALLGWQVRGVEPSLHASSCARAIGVEVLTGTLESIPEFPQGFFDLILGWMVLEHLPNPVDALRRLHRLASDDGWLAISVPNLDSLAFRVFGSDWYDLDLPRHLFHYTPNTLSRVLEHSGWRVERLIYQRTVRDLIGSLGLALESRSRRLRRLARHLVEYAPRSEAPEYFLLALSALVASAGKGGRMTVWARKAP